MSELIQSLHLFDPSNVDAAAADATPAFQSTRQKELMEQIASLKAKVEVKEKQLKEQAEARSKQAETAKKRLTRQKELMERIASLDAQAKQLKEKIALAEARDKQAEIAKRQLMHHINPEAYHRTKQAILGRWQPRETEHGQKMGSMQTLARTIRKTKSVIDSSEDLQSLVNN